MKAVVHASSQFIAQGILPEKAIDVMDLAGARVKLRRTEEAGSAEVVTPNDIAESVVEQTGVPVSEILQPANS